MSRHDERERIRRRLGALQRDIGAGRASVIGADPARAGGVRMRPIPLGSPISGFRGRPGDPRSVARPDAADSDVCGAATDFGKWELEQLAPEPGRRAGEFAAVERPKWLDEPADRAGWWERLVPERFRGTRLDPGRRGVLTLAAVGLATVAVAVVMVVRDRPVAQAVPPPTVHPAATSARSAHTSGAPSVAPPANTELVVSVVGLVRRGGLHRLPPGSRVADAVAAAGGATEEADLTGLNLAQRLQDGDQVVVGSRQSQARSGSSTVGGANTTASGRPAVRVDLNTATESELDALPGVGPATARAILTWRATNGRFTDVSQLSQIDGIGPAKLSRLRDLVTV
ncbi:MULTISPECIES: helix-hairpin-helix domain-containing protein [unclassified Nocardia]|uniref:ComEA family DNA-binding protein n=1 Tax=unclassified Nocardia TaxID=2637762 RepID=UPI001CE42E60|nr:MULTISPECIES: helix-hairpin-helix domain-containing protein [unclassified Nocardia]